MHLLIFGLSFSELVALILLFGLALFFLNKKQGSSRTNAEDADARASASSGGSSSSPVEADEGAVSAHRNEKDAEAGASANYGGSSSSPVETNVGASCSSPTKTDNSLSSSSIASTGNSYEVFLSFRGPDTRDGFTSHLYKELLRVGVHTFRDDDELRVGKSVGPELMAAIQKSRILIPILSVTYGTSRWCLDELVRIMECEKNDEQMVLPIFYKVEPADVRYQKGSFGDAFHKWVGRLPERPSFDPAILGSWKKALAEVSKLKGYEAIGNEAELVELIVREVLRELKKKFELVVPEKLVGIESPMKEVLEFVNNKSHVTLFVGIYGMGGIGKTTLAKAIYNKLFDQFEHHSFIADVRESSRNGVHYLQKQLLRDILQQEIEVCNEDDGAKSISSRCKGKKVIILLDDVDKVAQLHYLVGKREWFSLGSIIIITTRDQKILEDVGVDHRHECKELDCDQSLILFSRHAFRRDSPPDDFEGLTREVVPIAGGLPLCLEVFGSSLHGKDSKQWIETIKKLKIVPPSEVKEKLRVSYAALDYGQKQIFLDIACFLIGTDCRIAYYMWDTCNFFPGEGIQVLICMSLIKVGDDHKLRMHDQLRDLGRDIVREGNNQRNNQRPWCWSRIWDPEEAVKVLKGNKGTDEIEAINLSKGSSEGYGKTAQRDNGIYTEKHFKNLTCLRFLNLNGAHLEGDFGDTLGELKWLRWPYCHMDNEVKNLHANKLALHANKLAVLELYGSEINEKWKGWSSFKMAVNLKFLDLSSSRFLEYTDFLSAFKNLEVLILNNCHRLQRIHSSIGDMKALLRLDLGNCPGLGELPEEIGKLKALEQLLLRETKALSVLPESIELLENLEILDISWSGIQRLPNGIGRLGKLQKLKALCCKNPEGEMPQSLSDLSSLRYLDFECCSKLQSLPDLPPSLTYLAVTCQSRNLPSLYHPAHLKGLRVRGCKSLECIQALPSTLSKNSESSQPTDIEESESESELPQSLTTPFKLEHLAVYNCNSIETLDVSQFIHLRILSVIGCGNLLAVRGLDNLIRLEYLTLRGNPIEQLNCTKLVGLKRLGVEACNKLVKIHGLDRLESLERLDISESTSIERLFLPKSRSMKELNAWKCERLANIHDLDRLEFLESLNISRCTSIETLLLPKSESMKILEADGCENLAKIEGLDTLMFLEELYIAGCTSIDSLDLPKFGRMKELCAEGCKNLAKIEGLNTLEFLEQLYIDGCTLIKSLDLSKSKRLKRLKAGGGKRLADFEDSERLERLDFLYNDECMNELYGGCKILAKIQGLNELEFLESLNISGCTSIEMLLLPKSRSLKILLAEGCENLAKIEGLDTLMFLEVLTIAGCTSIVRLDLPKPGRMKELCAEGCKSLAKIEGLDTLEFLEQLYIAGCTSIERLDLSKSKRLKRLKAGGGKHLADVEDLERLGLLDFLYDVECMNELYGGCKNLVEIQGLDELEFLESLNISGCTSIETLLLPKSRSLKILHADGCENLAKFEGLDTLEFLDIAGCTSIEGLDLSKSWCMKILHADGCENLAKIEGLDTLAFLEELHIAGCSMKILNVDGCENLAKIEGLDTLEFLEELHSAGCTSIETLLLPKSGSLKILHADGCENLAKIEGLNTLEFLEELHIAKCTSIERLDLPKSGRMKELYAEGCKNLAEIAGLDTLEFLEKLYIDGCTLIKRLDLSKSKRLKRLTAGGGTGLADFEDSERSVFLDFQYDDECMNELYGGCKNLAEIQGLDKLEFLESLNISGCTSIEMLLLPKSRHLKILFARSCEKLTEIKGLDKLEFLEMLSIQDCSSIERLDLSKSRRLKTLEAGGCKRLAEIQGLDRLEFLEKLDIEGSKVRQAQKSHKGDTVKT